MRQIGWAELFYIYCGCYKWMIPKHVIFSGYHCLACFQNFVSYLWQMQAEESVFVFSEFLCLVADILHEFFSTLMVIHKKEFHAGSCWVWGTRVKRHCVWKMGQWNVVHETKLPNRINEFKKKIWSECIKPLWSLIKSQFSRGSREYAYIITAEI